MRLPVRPGLEVASGHFLGECPVTAFGDVAAGRVWARCGRSPQNRRLVRQQTEASLRSRFMASTLATRLLSVAERMQADFNASKATKHPGSRGTEREEILARILKLYLPGSIEVVHNAAGEVSSQCDILLIDNRTPKLQDLKSHRIVPAECVYCMIEVKSRLTGPEFIKSCKAIGTIRSMPRNAHVEDPAARYKIRDVTYPILPINCSIFSYDSIGFNYLGKKASAWCDENSVESYPDNIWVNDKGFFFWSTFSESLDRLLNVTDTTNRELRSIETIEKGDVLLAMIVGLSAWLTNARLPAVKLPEYLNTGRFYPGQRYWPSGNPLTIGELMKRPSNGWKATESG